MQRNLYRIDDVLLRAGGAALLLLLALAGGIVVVELAAGSASEPGSGGAALARQAPMLALAALCPIALLGAGISFRRKENRVEAVWNLLRQNAELSVPALLHNSDFVRADLERAVCFLNNRGLGHYVWDRSSDTIQDGRLGSLQLHFEKCEECGARVSLRIPIAFHEIPRCPFCHDPVSAASLEERRREAIEAIRSEHRPERPRSKSAVGLPGSFSIALFLVLLFVFWPAALAYAWLKWRAGS